MCYLAGYVSDQHNRLPWATISPTDCLHTGKKDPLNPQLYVFWPKNDTALMTGTTWSLYPFQGICPATGVTKICISGCTYSYSGTINAPLASNPARRLVRQTMLKVPSPRRL
jgi:hypothetical protein